MSLPPFDGTGWIEGMPGLPGGGGGGPDPQPVAITITSIEPVTGAFDTLRVLVPTFDPPEFAGQPVNVYTGDTSIGGGAASASMVFSFPAGTAPGIHPVRLVFKGTDDYLAIDSAPVDVEVTAAAGWAGTLTLTETPPETVPAGTPIVLDVVASIPVPAGDVVTLRRRVEADVIWNTATRVTDTTFTFTVDTTTGFDPYQTWTTFAEYAGVESNDVGLTCGPAADADPDADTLSGWTKAELIWFAENHNPPIQVNPNANKHAIIALILAALNEGD